MYLAHRNGAPAFSSRFLGVLLVLLLAALPLAVPASALSPDDPPASEAVAGDDDSEAVAGDDDSEAVAGDDDSEAVAGDDDQERTPAVVMPNEAAMLARAVLRAARAEGETPPVWLVIPFVVLLLMIATGPLFYAHHWHHHYPKYAIGLGIIVALYYIFAMHTWLPIEHAVVEYLAFIALVASLFIAASGIFVSINAKGTPRNNIILLLGPR